MPRINRPTTSPRISDMRADLTADGALGGWAQVHGERWRVSSTAPAAAGHAVRVTARRGLTLTAVPAEARQQGESS
ncbi:NfeD family protein [Paraburkholderia strydomiana]|uniref:NfeD family protein n=2 Tax=Paraburkholderia strydomiana TaxID=1245417 RepID=UPI0038B83870